MYSIILFEMLHISENTLKQVESIYKLICIVVFVDCLPKYDIFRFVYFRG